MNLVALILLFSIVLYTLGFAATMWKEKQKVGAFAAFCLASLISILPFFTIFKN